MKSNQTPLAACFSLHFQRCCWRTVNADSWQPRSSARRGRGVGIWRHGQRTKKKVEVWGLTVEIGTGDRGEKKTSPLHGQRKKRKTPMRPLQGSWSGGGTEGNVATVRLLGRWYSQGCPQLVVMGTGRSPVLSGAASAKVSYHENGNDSRDGHSRQGSKYRSQNDTQVWRATTIVGGGHLAQDVCLGRCHGAVLAVGGRSRKVRRQPRGLTQSGSSLQKVRGCIFVCLLNHLSAVGLTQGQGLRAASHGWGGGREHTHAHTHAQGEY